MDLLNAQRKHAEPIGLKQRKYYSTRKIIFGTST
jgi:hypothetical protein